VVTDNDGGAIFSFLPQAEALPADRYELLFGTPHGTDLTQLAASHHLEARVVTAITDIVASPGRRVLVARTDRSTNVVVHRSLNEAVIVALQHLLEPR
jgi:2-succinyl-5-enolpyruvyl-6-hydroxy-3-cyclohexene-1-carboxylate synthase